MGIRRFLRLVFVTFLVFVAQAHAAPIKNVQQTSAEQPKKVIAPQPKERPVEPVKVKQEVKKVEVAAPAPQAPQPQPTQPVSNREIGQQMAAAKGWAGGQWNCLEQLWTKESNWNHSVGNHAGSGAYGIPQALPASKMATHGADYLTNPRTQIAWGLDYIQARYSNPCNALYFWLNQAPHWY